MNVHPLIGYMDFMMNVNIIIDKNILQMIFNLYIYHFL